MEQTIATKRRRNIGKSVTAKTRACLRPDVPRRRREDTIMIPAPFILPLSRSPSTQPLFFHFSQSLFPHFLWRTDGRTDGRGKSRKSKSGNGWRGKSQLPSQRRQKTAAVKKCSTVGLGPQQVEERDSNDCSANGSLQLRGVHFCPHHVDVRLPQ